MTDFRNNPKITARGVRNNNPFNLQKTGIGWQGKVKGPEPRFETFDTVENGIRAGIIDIVGDITIDKQNTIEKLMKIFAPRSENNTEAYIQRVAADTNFLRNEKLSDANNKVDFKTIFWLAKSIIKHENGPLQANFITNDILIDSIKTAFNSSALKLRVNKPNLYALPPQREPKTGTTDEGYLVPTLIMILLFSILILINK
jgi:hypothetical protein